MHIDDETGQSIPPRVKCYVTIALMLSVVSVIAEAVVEQDVSHVLRRVCVSERRPTWFSSFAPFYTAALVNVHHIT
jgi:hypothetical protein